MERTVLWPGDMPDIREKAHHVIVVMLENRSFDNMLGHAFNPDDMPPVGDAAYTVGVDPDHSHTGVMWEMLGGAARPTVPAPTSPLTMSGFERAYADVGGNGPDVSKGFRPEQVPVLSALAREYAVCTRWFSSVPGQTWPNRNFAHAGTSDGEVDIKVRLYRNPTIFERLDDAGATWRVYHEGPAQVWCFPALWPRPFRNRFDDHADLLADIRNDELPGYSFVEPDHGLVFKNAQRHSNSQHPTNNLKNGRDFVAGERLLHSIYDALIQTPAVFRKTLLVVVYDEHGGFADHVPPPSAVPPDNKGLDVFGFNILGPRVPAVLVSPWIPRGTVDAAVYDHASIPRTLRELFAPGATPLTRREQQARLLLHSLSLDKARDSFPSIPSPELHPTPLAASAVIEASAELAAEPRDLDSFQESLVRLAQIVDHGLDAARAEGRAGSPEAVVGRVAAATADLAGPVAAPRAFHTEAERQFFLQDVTRRLQHEGA